MKKAFATLGVVAGALFAAPAAHGATIDVTTVTDEAINPGTGCALREAIEAANQNTDIGGCDTGVEVTGPYGSGTDRDTILLDAATYGVTMPGAVEDLNGSGDFDVFGGGPVTITGSGTSASFVQAGINDRVFDHHGAFDLRLELMTVRNGNAFAVGSQSGGNIRAATPGTSLTLDRVTVSNGRGSSGGGIIVGGAGSKLTAIDSDFNSNHAESNGGGVNMQFDTFGEFTRTDFRLNEAVDDNNGSQARGGGLSWAGDGLSIVDSTFAGNQAIGTDPGIAGNGFMLGGGVNAAGDGPMSIRGTTFSGNLVSNDGATEREEGGGLYYSGNFPDAEVVNSTFYLNTAGDNASPEGVGGGVHYDTAAVSGNLTIASSTIKDNDAIGPGGDQLDVDPVSEKPITVVGSILTRLGGDPCVGDVVSAGGNVADPDPDCGFGAADSTAGAAIGLAASPSPNGGPTPTIPLDPAGRAVDFVPAALCVRAAGIDQRGSARPNGPRCDAGAYEAVSPPVVKDPVPPPPVKCKKGKKRKKKSKKSVSFAAKKKGKKKSCVKKKRKKKKK